MSTLFKQESATNPNDDYLIGTPFEPFAKICLENHQPSFEQCKNIDFIHSFLKQHYKHGWKPREQGDPVYMNIEGMYYNCMKHKQTPLGNCQCLPKCPACNHGQHIKIYNRPIDKGKTQTDKQMRHGYCVPIKGFGPGKYEDCKVYENVAQCAGGSASTTGFLDGPPLVTGAQIGDSGTGLHLCLGIVTALFHREKSPLFPPPPNVLYSSLARICI